MRTDELAPAARKRRGAFSLSPISEKSMRYRVELHERIFRVSDTETGVARASKNPVRGAVRGISKKSRSRLVRLLAKINRPDEPLFVTLTYREFTEDFEAWKADLHRFVCSFRYHFPQLAGVWRLEFQKRGAPHYHVLLWLGDESPLEGVTARIRSCWLAAIGQHSEANEKHGVEVEPCTDFRRSAFYIAAYQAKDHQDRTDILTGREWGVWARERLNLAAVATVELCSNGLRLFRRIVRRGYIAHQRRHGFRVGHFAQSLGVEQPFSAFMPLAASYRLAGWVRENVEQIVQDNVRRSAWQWAPVEVAA